METKHTPAPWGIHRGYSKHVFEIVGSKRESICATHNWLESDPVEESRANALLIAASPDLLIALQAQSAAENIEFDVHAEAFLKLHGWGDFPHLTALEFAFNLRKLAIAKARGE